MKTKHEDRLSSVEEALYGREPMPPQVTSDENLATYLREAMHYYTYAVSSGQKKQWFLDYVDNTKESDAISHIDDSFFAVAGALARIWCLGTRVPKHGIKLQEYRLKFLKEGMEIEKQKQEKKKLADLAKEKAKLAETNDLLSKVDIIIDDIISGKVKEVDVPLFFKTNKVSEENQKNIKEKFKSLYAELSSSGEEMVEAYAYLGKTKKKIVSFLNNLVNGLLVEVKSPRTIRPRKPRKKRAVNPDKVVAKLQYCLSTKIGKTEIKSIDPRKVLGSKEVWVYNTKYRSLAKLVAKDGGFTIKGTTIHNFDEDQSMTKKLRKPDEVVHEVVNGGKVYLRKVMDSLTTKPAKTTGRMSKEAIILRVT